MMAEVTRTVEPLKITDPILDINGFYLYYGNKEALRNISLVIPRKRVTAFIGPSGCGKSTLLRCFNRMNDLIEGIHVVGTIKLDGEDINAPMLMSFNCAAVWAWCFKIQSLSQIDLRKRGLRLTYCWGQEPYHPR